MTELGSRVAAIELTVATQAVELRGAGECGAGTAVAVEIVRRHIPFLSAGDTVPDLESLVVAVIGRAFAGDIAVRPVHGPHPEAR